MRMKVSYTGTDVQPDNVVVIRTNHLISIHQLNELYRVSQKAFPDNTVLILPPDVSLLNFTRQEFLKYWNNVKSMAERRITE